jgi:hypothetical protein
MAALGWKPACGGRLDGKVGLANEQNRSLFCSATVLVRLREAAMAFRDAGELPFGRRSAGFAGSAGWFRRSCRGWPVPELM